MATDGTTRSARWRRTATAAAATGSLLLMGSAATALAAPTAPAADAPGAPGASATWTTGDKDGVGTSVTRDSKVWYTLTGGTMSEVYYPGGDTPNVRELQLAVTDGTATQLETDATVTRSVALADPTSLTYTQTSTDKAGRWSLTKTYVTDPARSSVLVDVSFRAAQGSSGTPFQLYALYDPSLAGDATHDSGRTVGDALVSDDTHNAKTPVASALVASTGFDATSTGYVGSVSDPKADLVAHHALSTTYASAGAGNIAQAGRIPMKHNVAQVTLALGFAGTANDALSTAKASLGRAFQATRNQYQRGWSAYLASTKPVPASLDPALATQYRVSLMTVKAHEDKSYPGAFIASLTVPWGQAVDASGSSGGGQGYHFVWARDE